MPLNWRLPYPILDPILGLLLFCATALPAASQQVSCGRLQRDIQAIDQTSSTARASQLTRQAEKAAAQAEQLAQQMDAAGCGQSKFLFFGSDPPEQCAAMGQQVDKLNQRSLSFTRQAETAATGADRAKRRAQLVAAYDARQCASEAQAVATGDTPLPNLDGPSADQTQASQSDQQNPTRANMESADQNREAAYTQARGVSGGICVRLCDGYFFPLSGATSRAKADDMCQAQCPATETKVYYKRGSNLAAASATNGASYSSLPNAFAFQKTYDPVCTCRQPGESWLSALQQAETMVSARGKPDLVSTAQNAAQWQTILPKLLAGKLNGKKLKGKTPIPDTAEAPAEPAPPPTIPASPIDPLETGQDITAALPTEEDITIGDADPRETSIRIVDDITDLPGVLTPQ